MKTCLICKKPTKNEKFCSRSCSATNSNKVSPKRKLEGSCKSCNKSIKSAYTYCKSCFTNISDNGFLGDITLKEAIYKKHHRSSAFALIRARARKVLPHTPCKSCGYNKHTEVCHIKSIKDFSEDTLISVINSLDNLIRLCPNCHWEFDSGKLKISVALSN